VIAMQNAYRASGSRPRMRRAILIRAGVAQKFGSLVIFFSSMLLGIGGYQLVQTIAHPLEAQPTEVIGAAVVIALACIMLFYVVEARSSWYASQRAHRRHKTHIVERSLSVAEVLAHDSAAMPSKVPFAPGHGHRGRAGY
jgi:hypothetical protein